MPARSGRTFAACLACSIALWLFSLASIRCPGVNETHYLGKARHYWTSDWCAGDLLLESQNAHVVFFSTVGAVTKFASLDVSARLGRLIGLVVFATGWCTLGCRISGTRAATILGLMMFCAYAFAVQRNPWVSLSGEWVLGGIEGKVLAWGFGLAALRFGIDRRWIPFGVLVGLAASFHPVVGAWLALCVVGGEVVSLARRDAPWSGGCKPLVIGAVLSVLTAAPGLVPAFNMIRTAPEIPASLVNEVRDANHLRARADYVQVFGRLKHHLDPMEFETRTWVLYCGMIVVSVVLWRLSQSRSQKADGAAVRRLHQIVFCAIAVAQAAVLIGYGPRPAMHMTGYAWKAQFLKLYPFRIADALIPMVLCLQLAGVISSTRFMRGGGGSPTRAAAGRRSLALAGGLWFAVMGTVLATNRASDHSQDWLSVCKWIRQSTPRDSVCVTPREAIDFKWFAHRAEFVNYKDCPQDPAGIAEWNRRLFVIRDWRQASIDDDGAYSRKDLARLAEVSGATYLVTHRIGPVLAEPNYANGTYRVYQLAGERKHQQ